MTQTDKSSEMNDHVKAAKLFAADDLAPSEIGYRLNETPMSALRDVEGRKYGYPREAFKLLSSTEKRE